jgi:hypothetical protein
MYVAARLELRTAVGVLSDLKTVRLGLVEGVVAWATMGL